MYNLALKAPHLNMQFKLTTAWHNSRHIYNSITDANLEIVANKKRITRGNDKCKNINQTCNFTWKL